MSNGMYVDASGLFQWSYPRVSERTIDNPIGQPLVVTWQENGQIQFRGCKDYEELERVYRQNRGRTNLKCVKSVVLNPTEVETLAKGEVIEKEEKRQRELDQKEFDRLKEKLYGTGSYALAKEVS